MFTQNNILNDDYSTLKIFTNTVSSLGALGVALQNYQAIVLVINGLTAGIQANRLLSWAAQIAALSTGGLCSGMVNFWMNAELLDAFVLRMTSEKAYQYTHLNSWEKLQYFSGIFVFIVTGVLFGLMAFTFAMTGPLAILSIVSGIFVSVIMIIQELETWFGSYDEKELAVESSLTSLELFGKWVGHIIALFNVIALSLLFTLSLAQALIALNVAAYTALIVGFVVAFTFGAFTEYYFYNLYLSNFCKDFGVKCSIMTSLPNSEFAFLCVATNALVNGVMTYAGIGLLSELLIAASIALPPVMAITVLAAVSAFFAGSASFILGLDFWTRQNSRLESVDFNQILSSGF